MERYLIESCAPTLASLKTASLFSMPFETEEELECQLTYWNTQMKTKGIRLQVMRRKGGRALIYVCRISQLLKNLEVRLTIGRTILQYPEEWHRPHKWET